MPGSPKLPYRHGAAHIGAIYKKLGRSGPLTADVVQAVLEYQGALGELAQLRLEPKGRSWVARAEQRARLVAALEKRRAALKVLDAACDTVNADR